MLLFCRSCCRASGTGAGLLCCFSAAGDPSRLPAAAGRACLFACLFASSVGSCRRPFVCFQASRRPAFSASVPAAGDPSRLPAAAGAMLPGPGFLLCCRYASRLPAAADQEPPPGYVSIISICFYAAGVFYFLGSGKASRHRGPISDYI